MRTLKHKWLEDKIVLILDNWTKDQTPHCAVSLEGRDKDKEILLNWIGSNLGSKVIDSYEKFLNLATVLSNHGYNLNPLLTEVEFNETVLQFKKEREKSTQPSFVEVVESSNSPAIQI